MQLLFLRGSAPVKVLIDKPEGDHRMQRLRPGGEEYLLDLGADPLRGKLRGKRRFLPDGREGRRFYLKAEAGGEAESAEHTQRVLIKALFGRADAADAAAADILRAAVGVDDEPVGGDGHRVHREVAPHEVGRQVADEGDAARVAVVGVIALGAEGRDLRAARADDDRHGAVLYPGRP